MTIGVPAGDGHEETACGHVARILGDVPDRDLGQATRSDGAAVEAGAPDGSVRR